MAKYIVVSVAEQTLTLFDSKRFDSKGFDNKKVIVCYPIATAKNGTGQVNGSECTPLGVHSICEKIGDDVEVNSVFIGRKATGEVYTEQLASQYPDRDWILTRILWLQGEEDGHNKGGNCDSKARYIYIHGCPDSHPMQVPSSHGCIKIHNVDMINLYNIVTVGTVIRINKH